MVICLEQGADLHMAQLMPVPLTVSCFSKIQIGFTFLVPAHPGSHGKRAVKRVCVCVCVCYPLARIPQIMARCDVVSARCLASKQLDLSLRRILGVAKGWLVSKANKLAHSSLLLLHRLAGQGVARQSSAHSYSRCAGLLVAVSKGMQAIKLHQQNPLVLN